MRAELAQRAGLLLPCGSAAPARWGLRSGAASPRGRGSYKGRGGYRCPVGAPPRRDGASDRAPYRREGAAPTKTAGPIAPLWERRPGAMGLQIKRCIAARARLLQRARGLSLPCGSAASARWGLGSSALSPRGRGSYKNRGAYRSPVGAPPRRHGASDQALHRREGAAPTKTARARLLQKPRGLLPGRLAMRALPGVTEHAPR